MISLLLTASTTVSGPDPAGLVALAALAFLGWRLVLITAFPYSPHRHCKGSGKHWARGNFRPCRGCKGTGRRLRVGRRVWNWTQDKGATR